MQLSIYALASQQFFKLPCEELLLLHIREDACTEVKTKRSQLDLGDARQQIEQVKKRIEAADFTAKPELNKCKRCPYRRICDMAICD